MYPLPSMIATRDCQLKIKRKKLHSHFVPVQRHSRKASFTYLRLRLKNGCEIETTRSTPDKRSNIKHTHTHTQTHKVERSLNSAKKEIHHQHKVDNKHMNTPQDAESLRMDGHITIHHTIFFLRPAQKSEMIFCQIFADCS